MLMYFRSTQNLRSCKKGACEIDRLWNPSWQSRIGCGGKLIAKIVMMAIYIKLCWFLGWGNTNLPELSLFFIYLFIKALQHKCWRSVGHQVLQPGKLGQYVWKVADRRKKLKFLPSTYHHRQSLATSLNFTTFSLCLFYMGCTFFLYLGCF